MADRPHPLGVREHDLGRVRLEDPGDRSAFPVASITTRSVGARLCANSSATYT
ncbi:MAG: hypothetical protein ACXVVQ_13300 [Solirubrobacteraceae bacterium]